MSTCQHSAANEYRIERTGNIIVHHPTKPRPVNGGKP